MDSHRGRRTKDKARKAWYAYYRQLRFARWLGFVKVEGDLIQAYRRIAIPNRAVLRRFSGSCRFESRSSGTSEPIPTYRTDSEDGHETFTASSSYSVR